MTTKTIRSLLIGLLSLPLVGGLGCGGKGPGATAPSQPPASLAEQLARGDAVWLDSCASCHGDGGEGKGGENPAVVSGRALRRYKTGGEVLTFIVESMPKDDPGSLSDTDYLAVTAWLLRKNGRLGDTSPVLTAESAAAIRLE